MRPVNVSAPFILRPIATSLLMLLLLMLGLAAYALLPIAALPQVDLPTIQISASLPGAAPEVMATTVTSPRAPVGRPDRRAGFCRFRIGRPDPGPARYRRLPTGTTSPSGSCSAPNEARERASRPWSRRTRSASFDHGRRGIDPQHGKARGAQLARQQTAAAADVEDAGAGCNRAVTQRSDDARPDPFDMLRIAHVVDPRKVAQVVRVARHRRNISRKRATRSDRSGRRRIRNRASATSDPPGSRSSSIR